MDRAPFNLPFSETFVPSWPCPQCRTGHLSLVPKSLVKEETTESLREHDDPAWDPDWIRYVFSCIFRCSSSSCEKVFACCGDGKVEYHEYEDETDGWVQSSIDHFTPKYFNPPLLLMDVPTSCPRNAATHLSESFALYFSDAGAALNCNRAAVEAVLTDLGIKRYTNLKGKRRPISLHQRINLLPAKYADVKDLLLAVKWLGNAGSHDGEKPSYGDVRTTYDLLEYVLAEIYESKTKKLKAIAKNVNAKKGRLKK